MRRDPSKWSKPVEYKGTTFRSHLEARWAVFFDALGFKCEYEPALERVRTGLREVLYAPDFHLESELLDLMVEIKPKEPEEGEIIKAAAWAREFGEDVLILFGPVAPPPDGVNGWLMEPDLRKNGPPILKKDYWFCECPRCGRIGVAEYGDVPEPCVETCFTDSDEDLGLLFSGELKGHLSPKLLAAYHDARTYRFVLSTAKGKPKFPPGPPTPKMVDFLIRLLERAGEDPPHRYEIESMRFGDVRAWINELLNKEDDERW